MTGRVRNETALWVDGRRDPGCEPPSKTTVETSQNGAQSRGHKSYYGRAMRRCTGGMASPKVKRFEMD